MCIIEIVCVCVYMREREKKKHDVYRKQEDYINKNQQLQREGQGAYVVTFSLSSHTTTASWERGGVLTIY